jgi:hypothetical protein
MDFKWFHVAFVPGFKPHFMRMEAIGTGFYMNIMWFVVVFLSGLHLSCVGVHIVWQWSGNIWSIYGPLVPFQALMHTCTTKRVQPIRMPRPRGAASTVPAIGL